MSNYTDLIDNPLILWDLNAFDPSIQGHINNCPATADAVDNFLNTGQREAANSSRSRFQLTANFARRPWSDIVSSLVQLGPDHHYVIRGTRPRRSRQARNHFFVVANVRGSIYIIDAYIHSIMPQQGLDVYLRRGNFESLEFATSFETR